MLVSCKGKEAVCYRATEAGRLCATVAPLLSLDLRGGGGGERPFRKGEEMQFLYQEWERLEHELRGRYFA